MLALDNTLEQLPPTRQRKQFTFLAPPLNVNSTMIFRKTAHVLGQSGPNEGGFDVISAKDGLLVNLNEEWIKIHQQDRSQCGIA